MKKLFTYMLALLAGILSTAMVYAASPSVVGSWNVTFFLEPGRSIGATQCIVFTLIPGTVAGVATSGIWTSPTFPGWAGQWIQLGDHVRWFGVTGGLSTTESGNMEHNNIFGGVSFNHFFSSNAATSSAGSWNGARVSSCRIGLQELGSDPSGLTTNSYLNKAE